MEAGRQLPRPKGQSLQFQEKQDVEKELVNQALLDKLLMSLALIISEINVSARWILQTFVVFQFLVKIQWETKLLIGLLLHGMKQTMLRKLGICLMK